MDKDKIKAEFNDFVDTASEATLRDFINYMKARKKTKAERDEKIRRLFDEDDSNSKEG